MAARAALSRAGLSPADIDCYIVATVTPDYPFPATACIVASKLGAADKAAFDIEIACSGFIYGLTVAASLIRSGVYKRIMLIGAETLTKIVNRMDRATAVLFGDGAGAVILEASQADSFLSSELGSDGSRPEVLRVAAGGSRNPLTPAAYEAGEQYLHMEGREVFKFAVTKMIEATDTALEKANLQKARPRLADSASGEQTHHRRGGKISRDAGRQSHHQHPGVRQHVGRVDSDCAFGSGRHRKDQKRRHHRVRRFRRRASRGAPLHGGGQFERT